jgi:ABC-type nitrate/sulfonate/bicarbonate transport system substrate-binding protein
MIKKHVAALTIGVALATFAPMFTIPMSQAGAASNPTISVAIGSQNWQFGAFYVAQAYGLFAKNKVNVNVTSYSASSIMTSLLVSGQIQLGITSDVASLQIAQAGEPSQLLFNTGNIGAGADAVISPKSITSVSQLKSGTCNVVTQGPGKGSYALIVAWERVNDITNCGAVVAQNVPIQIADVESGSDQAAAVSYGAAEPYIQAGLVNVLYNPSTVTKAVAKQMFANPYPAFGVIGLTSTLQTNSAAVTRFIKAMRQAQQLLITKTPLAISKVVAKTPGWVGTPVSAVEVSLKSELSSYATGKTAGIITAASWAKTLAGLVDWDIAGYSSTTPAYQYATAINMSYFNKAG